MLQLEHICPKAYNFSCTIIYSNPKSKDKTLQKVLEFVFCHDSLLFTKGSMEVDSAIEVLELTL